TPPPPVSLLFPYTTLFRSVSVQASRLSTTPSIYIDYSQSWPNSDRTATIMVEWAATHTRLYIDGDLVDEGDPTESAISTTRVERSEEHTSELQSRFDLVCR